jgi:TolA-binding protein
VEPVGILRIGGGGCQYARVVLECSEKHPDDPRVPEALSRAVKNTRMNCNNARTSALSEAAFDLLHKRYPNTTWAKSTKYWY